MAIQLTENELETFNQLIDMAPDLCRTHTRENDGKWDYGCANLGAFCLFTARRVSAGWLTRDDAIKEFQNDPTCGERCPLSAGYNPKAYAPSPESLPE